MPNSVRFCDLVSITPICAQLAHVIGIAAENSSYDLQLTVPGELHRIRPDIARTAVDNDGLTFTSLCVIEQHLPCRYANYRQCRRARERALLTLQ